MAQDDFEDPKKGPDDDENHGGKGPPPGKPGDHDHIHPVKPARPHGGGLGPSPSAYPGSPPVTPFDAAAEDRAMRDEFPQFQLQRLNREPCWVGTVWPFAHEDEIEAILADLDADEIVGVDSTTSLRHFATGEGYRSLPSELKAVTASGRLREGVLLWVFPPRASGHPAIYATKDRFRQGVNRHLYVDGGLCTRFTVDNDLDRAQPLIVQEVQQAIIWTAKQLVWEATGFVRRPGYWLGTEVGHGPLDYIKNTPLDAICPACSSARPYGQCCHGRHVQELLRPDLAQELSADMATRRIRMTLT